MTLFFDDVARRRRPPGRRRGRRAAVAFDGLNPERILAAAICTGIGRYALDKAAALRREREVWGKPIGTHQGIAHPLAEGKIELEAARLMTREGGAAARRRRARPGEASNMAKLLAADAGRPLRSTRRSRPTAATALALEYGLADLWFIVRLLRIAPVSREMILNYVAQHSLGLPRSY